LLNVRELWAIIFKTPDELIDITLP
jgi:hypothetical protein